MKGEMQLVLYADAQGVAQLGVIPGAGIVYPGAGIVYDLVDWHRQNVPMVSALPAGGTAALVAALNDQIKGNGLFAGYAMEGDKLCPFPRSVNAACVSGDEGANDDFGSLAYGLQILKDANPQGLGLSIVSVDGRLAVTNNVDAWFFDAPTTKTPIDDTYRPLMFQDAAGCALEGSSFLYVFRNRQQTELQPSGSTVAIPLVLRKNNDSLSVGYKIGTDVLDMYGDTFSGETIESRSDMRGAMAALVINNSRMVTQWRVATTTESAKKPSTKEEVSDRNGDGIKACLSTETDRSEGCSVANNFPGKDTIGSTFKTSIPCLGLDMVRVVGSKDGMVRYQQMGSSETKEMNADLYWAMFTADSQIEDKTYIELDIPAPSGEMPEVVQTADGLMALQFGGYRYHPSGVISPVDGTETAVTFAQYSEMPVNSFSPGAFERLNLSFGDETIYRAPNGTQSVGVLVNQVSPTTERGLPVTVLLADGTFQPIQRPDQLAPLTDDVLNAMMKAANDSLTKYSAGFFMSGMGGLAARRFGDLPVGLGDRVLLLSSFIRMFSGTVVSVSDHRAWMGIDLGQLGLISVPVDSVVKMSPEENQKISDYKTALGNKSAKYVNGTILGDVAGGQYVAGIDMAYDLLTGVPTSDDDLLPTHYSSNKWTTKSTQLFMTVSAGDFVNLSGGTIGKVIDSSSDGEATNLQLGKNICLKGVPMTSIAAPFGIRSHGAANEDFMIQPGSIVGYPTAGSDWEIGVVAPWDTTGIVKVYGLDGTINILNMSHVFALGKHATANSVRNGQSGGLFSQLSLPFALIDKINPGPYRSDVCFDDGHERMGDDILVGAPVYIVSNNQVITGVVRGYDEILGYSCQQEQSGITITGVPLVRMYMRKMSQQQHQAPFFGTTSKPIGTIIRVQETPYQVPYMGITTQRINTEHITVIDLVSGDVGQLDSSTKITPVTTGDINSLLAGTKKDILTVWYMLASVEKGNPDSLKNIGKTAIVVDELCEFDDFDEFEKEVQNEKPFEKASAFVLKVIAGTAAGLATKEILEKRAFTSKAGYYSAVAAGAFAVNKITKGKPIWGLN